MNVLDALRILSLSAGATQAEIKQAYRRAAAKYHPDRNPGGLKMMQLVNEALAILKDYKGEATQEKASFSDNYLDKLNEVINAIIGLPGLTLELCGLWIWVTGDTRTHKDAIKAAGYFFAPKKAAWYYRPAEYKSYNRGNWSLDDIRTIHGSEKLEANRNAKRKIAA